MNMSTRRKRMNAESPSTKADSPPSKETDADPSFTTVWIKEEVEEKEEKSEPESEEESSDDNDRYSPQCNLREEPINYSNYAYGSNQDNSEEVTEYKCDYCEYTHVNKKCLHLHMRMHLPKQYSCKICNFETNFPTSLHRHMLKKHQIDDLKDTEKLKCDSCSYTTYHKRDMSCHKRKHTNIKAQFQCAHCNYSTGSKYNFTKHSKVHIKNFVQYKCDKCPFTTKFEGHIVRHLAKIHNEVIEKAMKCELCEYTTRMKWRLNMHLQRSRKQAPLKCQYCEFETYYICQSKSHKLTHISEIYDSKAVNPYSIDPGTVLAVDSNQIDNTEMPMDCHDTEAGNEENSNNMAEYQQEHADYAKQDNNSINENLGVPNTVAEKLENFPIPEPNSSSHLAETNYADPENNSLINDLSVNRTHDHFMNTDANLSLYSNMAATQPHNSSHITEPYINIQPLETKSTKKHRIYTIDPNYEKKWHNIPVSESKHSKTFQCTSCDYTSKFKASVQRHFQRHHTDTNLRPYICLKCNFRTKTKDQISLHDKRSQMTTEMICEVCNYSTFFKCQYLVHRKSHYDHKCSVCNCSFKQKYDAQKHFEIMHMGRVFKCQFCDYTSIRKESVECHETIHTGLKPFRCDSCSYQAIRKGMLDKHRQRYHCAVKNDKTIVSESKIQSLLTPC